MGNPPYGVYAAPVSISLLCDDNYVPLEALDEAPAAFDALCWRNTGRVRCTLQDSRWDRRLRLTTFCLILFLTACGRDPGWLPLPAQQSLDLGPDPGGVGPTVKMEDPNANDYIVRDIGLMPGAWRWTFLHPELRFRVAHAEGLHFAAEIHIPEVTFKVTGPVVVAYSVDGRKLGFVRCDHPGTYTIDHPVPPGWLTPGDYIHVTFSADRHWVSPEDGAHLSFLLLRAGFTD
jgi:hypothetical protein